MGQYHCNPLLEDKSRGLTFTIPPLKRLGEWYKLAPSTMAPTPAPVCLLHYSLSDSLSMVGSKLTLVGNGLTIAFGQTESLHTAQVTSSNLIGSPLILLNSLFTSFTLQFYSRYPRWSPEHRHYREYRG